MMDYLFKTLDVVFNMMDFAFKMMEFALKMMEFALKMMNLMRRPGGRGPGWDERSIHRGAISTSRINDINFY